MKKYLLLLLVCILSACSNTITIQHVDTGYTKDLAYTIDLQNQNIVTKANYNNNVIYVEVKTNEYELVKNYYIDVNTFKEIEEHNPLPKYFNETMDIVTLETTNYSIISTYTWLEDECMIDVFYRDNHQNVKLFEFDGYSIYKTEYPVHGYFDKVNNQGYLIVPKESYFSIQEIHEGVLSEVKQVPYTDGNFEFKELIASENMYIYEDASQWKCVQNEDIMYIDKNVDGYTLKDYEYAYGNVFVYTKNDDVQLLIDGNIYNLGYQADFIVREHDILSTNYMYGTNKKETKVIDRKTKKEYILDQNLLLDDDYQIFDNYFLLKNYDSSNNFYSIVSIKNNKATAMDFHIPDTYEFIGADKDYMVFMNRDLKKAEFYVIGLE